MFNMIEQKRSLINRLEKDLPEGLVVDAAWLEARGISRSLRSYYVKSGWLEQPVRSVYRRPRGTLGWQQVVISLQTLLLKTPLIVSGRTALEMQGLAHYLPHETKTVHLTGPKPPPSWLQQLNLPQRFSFHKDETLFRSGAITYGPDKPAASLEADAGRHMSRLQGASLAEMGWGQWDWPLTLSKPERAVLEMLDELPQRESFHQVDAILQGAANLSPRLLQKLLADCVSVKVKRLFFFFAERHQHSWLKRLDKEAIDFGTGKRMLVKSGKLDPTYLITVPRDLDALS